MWRLSCTESGRRAGEKGKRGITVRGSFGIRIKNKIYISYLTSYLIIGLIPLLLSLAGYKICEKTIINEIRIAQDSILWQLQGAFDRNVESVIRMEQVLAGNERVAFLGSEYAFNSQSHLEMKKLRDELTVQLDKLDICEDIIIIFEKSGAFLTSDGVYQKELRDLFFQNSRMQEGDIKKILETSGLRGYVVGENSDAGREIYLIENVYSFNFKEKAAVIFARIPWEKIQSLGADVNAGSVYWQIRDGTILKVNGGEYCEDVPSYDSFAEEGELLYTGEGKGRNISSFRNSEYYDWKYCISMREKEYFAQLNKMKLVILGQMLLLLGVAVLMALYYSNQRYGPVERLMEAVRKNQRSGKGIQDFRDVESYLDSLYKENRKLADSWKKAQESMTGEIISGFIKGWNDDRAMAEETLRQKGICLEAGYVIFLVMLRDISECKLILSDQKDESRAQYQDMKLLEFVFRNVFEEVVQNTHRGMMIRMDSNYLYLVSMDRTALELVCEDIKKCSEIYGHYLNLHIFIGGSKEHKRIEDLPRAYNEAVQALGYQTFWGNSSEVLSLYETDYADSEEWGREENAVRDYYRHLYNLMQAGQYEKAERLLEEIMDHMFVRDMRYTKINQYRMSGLMNTVCMILTDLLGRNDEEFLKSLRPMERLMDERTVDSARKTMLEVFDELIAHLKQCMEEEKPKWVRETIQEIEEQYGDINLGLSVLAEKHGLNLAYMGRTFKQYTGCSVPDYIHRVRIRECKKLLLEGISVKETAQQVGYIDAKTLIRIFKKQEGITPGQFKGSME